LTQINAARGVIDILRAHGTLLSNTPQKHYPD
jgi:hypothetical protein